MYRKEPQKLGVGPLLPPPPGRDHRGYCTAEVGNLGGTYELPCIFVTCYVTTTRPFH